MARKNAGFISFRHGDYELTRAFVEQLYRGLCSEVEAQLGRGVDVFLDTKRLTGGYLFDEALAQELCMSSSMVMVYTPSYFDEAHTYCAREYSAMLQLEMKRLAMLDPAAQQHGLIVPVIFRGLKHLPAEIRDRRQYYDFQSFLLSGREMSHHPKFASVLQEIGEYIADRHRVISGLDDPRC